MTPTGGLDRVSGYLWWFLQSDGAVVDAANLASFWPRDGIAAANLLRPANSADVERASRVESCDCGLRIVEDLPTLIRYARAGQNGGGGSSSHFYVHWSHWPADYVAARAYWEVLDVPDVVGRAVGWRSVPLGAPEALSGSWRCERARVGDRLYVSPHLWRRAERVAQRYQAHVVVGSTLGAAWLEECREYEARHPDSDAVGVTYLAPAGSVLPSWEERGDPAPAQLNVAMSVFVARWGNP